MSIRELDSAIFTQALKILDTYGWCSVERRGGFSGVDDRRCLWLAVSDALIDANYLTTSERSPYSDILKDELRVKYLEDIFKLNDSKSDEDGPKWAKDVLRSVVAKIESAQVNY